MLRRRSKNVVKVDCGWHQSKEFNKIVTDFHNRYDNTRFCLYRNRRCVT